MGHEGAHHFGWQPRRRADGAPGEDEQQALLRAQATEILRAHCAGRDFREAAACCRLAYEGLMRGDIRWAVLTSLSAAELIGEVTGEAIEIEYPLYASRISDLDLLSDTGDVRFLLCMASDALLARHWRVGLACLTEAVAELAEVVGDDCRFALAA